MGKRKRSIRIGYELAHDAAVSATCWPLPTHVRSQARDAYALFRRDPSHPGLHFKKVHPDPPTFSARVGIGYRAVGVLHGDTVIWFWIGSHADYDKLLQQM